MAKRDCGSTWNRKRCFRPPVLMDTDGNREPPIEGRLSFFGRVIRLLPAAATSAIRRAGEFGRGEWRGLRGWGSGPDCESAIPRVATHRPRLATSSFGRSADSRGCFGRVGKVSSSGEEIFGREKLFGVRPWECLPAQCCDPASAAHRGRGDSGHARAL